MKQMNLLLLFLLVATATTRVAGQSDTLSEKYSLNDCINYALVHNIQVQQSDMSAEISQATANQLRASRFPTVEAQARQNFSWNDVESSTGEWNYDQTSATSLGINASLNIFSGLRTIKSIKQADVNYRAGLLDAQTQRDNIALQILAAYTQLLYSEEQVSNAAHQVQLTREQLNLAAERLNIGAIARADYLQVEAQQASEELTLINAQNSLATNRIALMQLMELPLDAPFDVIKPDLSRVQPPLENPLAAEVYNRALEVKPQVKSAALKSESALMEVDIARAGALPSLALDAGLSTNYTDAVQKLNFGSQLQHNVSPVLGFTLSVPIFHQSQIKTQVATAQIRSEITKLDGQTTLNQLRKNIENACLDVAASGSEFRSALQQYTSATASYEQASVRFATGVISPVDFLSQKTSLTKAENTLLQSRYNLIYSLKALDFYSGNSITL